MKRTMAVAALGLLGMSSAPQATTYVAATGVAPTCINQSNLFTFGFTGGALQPPIGPFVIRDIDGFISGAHPGQGIRFEVFAHVLGTGDVATEEVINPLLYGYTVADLNGIAPVSVHLTSKTSPSVENNQVACLHLEPTGYTKSLQVTLTLQADPPPSTVVASQGGSTSGQSTQAP
jgi:hypothetical protein